VKVFKEDGLDVCGCTSLGIGLRGKKREKRKGLVRIGSLDIALRMRLRKDL
jgi:hypothetical protein